MPDDPGLRAKTRAARRCVERVRSEPDQQAPTRLRISGALAGFAAGALATLVYTLHCPESGAPFVAVWYRLGMLIPTTAGALLGPRILHW